MSKLPQTIVVLALLAATALAFALTERLKLERSPVAKTRVDKAFSPVCDCPQNAASISFVLRHAETVTLDILDAAGRAVRTIVSRQREPKGRVFYVWDGRDDDGQLVPDGAYHPRVRLQRNTRTIVLPNRIRVDTVAPRIVLVSVRPRVFSPDGDGRRDLLMARFRVNERSQGLMLVDEVVRVVGRFRREQGSLTWSGATDSGGTVRAGTHEIRLRAVDEAGNRSRLTRAVAVEARYVELGRDRIETRAGKRFAVRVRTDALSYRWRLGGREGTTRRRVLTLRAPERPGRYVLVVRVGSHADRATVVVRAAP